MAWLGEMIAQWIWEGAVEVAYRKWGWVCGAITLVGPFIIFGLVIWLLVR